MELEEEKSPPEHPDAKKPFLSRGWLILIAAIITGLFLILESLLRG